MKTTIHFLRKLKKNNNTPWMHAHKDECAAAKKEFEFLVQELMARIGSWDSKLPILEPKQCIFRLNRDTRFSNNKSPYKENFGAIISYGGKKSNLPGYYIHVAPDEVFIAGGVWMPEPKELLRIRRYIIDTGYELQGILKNRSLEKSFGPLSDEHALKRVPKGFNPEDPHAELLKFKSFVIVKHLKVTEISRPDFGKLIEKDLKLIKPLNDYLYDAMTIEGP